MITSLEVLSWAYIQNCWPILVLLFQLCPFVDDHDDDDIVVVVANIIVIVKVVVTSQS